MVAQRNEQLFFWGLLLHPKLFLGLPDRPPPGLVKPRSWVSVHWPSAPTAASHTVRGQMGGKLGASSPLVWEAVRSKRRKSEARAGSANGEGRLGVPWKRPSALWAPRPGAHPRVAPGGHTKGISLKRVQPRAEPKQGGLRLPPVLSL